jgi:hypothetical protein
VKKQGTNMEQGSGNRDQESERLKRLLRIALAPAGDDVEPTHDLWPEMVRRMRAETAGGEPKLRVPWFDWALAAGLAALLALFPAWMPVLL